MSLYETLSVALIGGSRLLEQRLIHEVPVFDAIPPRPSRAATLRRPLLPRSE